MNESFHHLRRTALRVLIGTLLLLWIFHAIFLSEARRLAEVQGLDWSTLSRAQHWQLAWEQGPPELWRTLTLIPPWPLAISVLLMGLTLLLGMVRWIVVLRAQGLGLSIGRALEISFVAHFFNSFLLGSTGGDLMKAYYAARETHHKKTEAVVTVFVDRLVGLWAMLLFAGVMLVPNGELLAGQERLRTLALVILAMLAGCSFVVLVAFYGGVRRGWSGARAWLQRLPKGAWLERSLDSCRRFGNSPGFLLKSLGLSMLLNSVCVAQVWVLSFGLQQSVSPWVLFAIVPMIICISAIPITPSGLGVRENLYVLVLAAPGMGVDPTSALSLSLLAYAGSLFWSLVGGFVYMGLKERHHLDESSLQDDPTSAP